MTMLKKHYDYIFYGSFLYVTSLTQKVVDPY
jgi:hypothetical protein